jgi:predicted enzyme related to lactoylglutathione lyase
MRAPAAETTPGPTISAKLGRGDFNEDFCSRVPFGERVMAAHLYRVILPVTSIEEAARFYGAVLGEPGERVSSGRHYFGKGEGAILACYDPTADGDKLGEGWRHHSHQYVYFSVADLEATRDAAEKAGAKEVTKIARMPWGETLFYAKDPFGNPICFVAAGTEFKGG